MTACYSVLSQLNVNNPFSTSKTERNLTFENRLPRPDKQQDSSPSSRPMQTSPLFLPSLLWWTSLPFYARVDWTSSSVSESPPWAYYQLELTTWHWSDLGVSKKKSVTEVWPPLPIPTFLPPQSASLGRLPGLIGNGITVKPDDHTFRPCLFSITNFFVFSVFWLKLSRRYDDDDVTQINFSPRLIFSRYRPASTYFTDAFVDVLVMMTRAPASPIRLWMITWFSGFSSIFPSHLNF